MASLRLFNVSWLARVVAPTIGFCDVAMLSRICRVVADRVASPLRAPRFRIVVDGRVAQESLITFDTGYYSFLASVYTHHQNSPSEREWCPPTGSGREGQVHLSRIGHVCVGDQVKPDRRCCDVFRREESMLWCTRAR